MADNEDTIDKQEDANVFTQDDADVPKIPTQEPGETVEATAVSEEQRVLSSDKEPAEQIGEAVAQAPSILTEEDSKDEGLSTERAKSAKSTISSNLDEDDDLLVPTDPNAVAAGSKVGLTPPEIKDEDIALDDPRRPISLESNTDERFSTAEESAKPLIIHNGSIIKSDLKKWKNKPYLGGFKDKRTNTEFFHAYAQTTTPQEKAKEVFDQLTLKQKTLFHRDCQTVYITNEKTQTSRDAFTQMTTSGCYVTSESDKILRCGRYTTADELFKTQTQCAITIQCFFRQIKAKLIARKLLQLKNEKINAFMLKEKRRKELLEKQRILQNERRLHPKANKDFEILYSGLENWRAQETARINKLKLIEPARLAALADLVDQEGALIQKIDKLKIQANIENRARGIQSLLEKLSSPKKWVCKKNIMVSVDTPNIIRARELRDLYNALNYPLLSVDERLQILLHVKFTVKEFDCNLTREIVELIDREGDLISRGREEKTLTGLRQRIGNLFLQFIKTPEFNPEMAAHVSQLNVDNQSWKDSSVYYCRGCTKYKSSTEFYLSTTIKHLGKCKDCSLKENLAIQKIDDSSYGAMLKLIRHQEAIKRRNNPDPNQRMSNPMALLQESDIRYLVDVIWNRKSAISGIRQMDELILTRWDITQELSPWNCILLTKSEALTHDCQKNPDAVYSIDFRNKIFQKLLLARQHFAQLPAMAEHLRDHYEERDDGTIVLRNKSIMC